MAAGGSDVAPVPRAPDHARATDRALPPSAVATLLALAGIRVGEVVVDARCGAGDLTHPAAAAAGASGRVFGVDTDADALAAAAARRESRICWVRGDAGRLPFASHTVDKVLAAYPGGGTDEAHLAEYARLLLPGGRLVVAALVPAATTRRPDLARALRATGLRAVHEGAEEVAGDVRIEYATATPTRA